MRKKERIESTKEREKITHQFRGCKRFFGTNFRHKTYKFAPQNLTTSRPTIAAKPQLRAKGSYEPKVHNWTQATKLRRVLYHAHFLCLEFCCLSGKFLATPFGLTLELPSFTRVSPFRKIQDKENARVTELCTTSLFEFNYEPLVHTSQRLVTAALPL